MFWYVEALKKYATFSGRASRREYWWFALVSTLVTVALAIADIAMDNYSHDAGMGLLTSIYTLLVFLPSLGLAVRRLHDIDRSGWWLLIGLIPLIGYLVIIVFACLPGTRGANRFGLNPLDILASTETDGAALPTLEDREAPVPAVRSMRD